MKLKVGDTVAVTDDVMKGTIQSIDDKMVTILTTDGFNMKFHEDELVKIIEEQSEIAKKVVVSFDLKEKGEVKRRRNSVGFKTQSVASGPMEVDLHINKLVKSTRNMDNFDMLNLQLDTAKHKLEYAIKNRIPKVIFIHGVGAGVLKAELNFMLKRYNVNFYEASYQKYGMGATEVHINQSKRN